MTENGEVSELSFEEAYAALEAVVAQLGSDELPLNEALALFERGQALATRCQALLDNAELTVQQFSPDTGELGELLTPEA